MILINQIDIKKINISNSEDAKTWSILLIQRIWRDYKIGKLLNCQDTNKQDILKKCNVYLIDSLMKYSEFQKLTNMVISTIQLWREFTKKPSNCEFNKKIQVISLVQ